MYKEFKKKNASNRNKALYVMYMIIIIKWSYPTKFSIEQEPLKILKICDTCIFLTLQGIHAQNKSFSYQDTPPLHLLLVCILMSNLEK